MSTYITLIFCIGAVVSTDYTMELLFWTYIFIVGLDFLWPTLLIPGIYIGGDHMTGYSAAANIKRGKRLGSNDGGVDGRGV